MRRCICILIVCCFFYPAVNAQTSQRKLINVLIIDGFSNHDWAQTTKVIKQILEESRLFKVSVSTTPSRVEDAVGWAAWKPSFKDFDVVIQNTNNIANTNLRWPKKIETQLENYVKSGGGLYVLHSANNSFAHWKAYDKMIGLGWRSKETGYALEITGNKKIIRIPPDEGQATSHGEKFNAIINIIKRHPINEGMPKQWKTAATEVYNYARGPAENITVLSVSYDSTATKKTWPVEWLVKYGKGNVYSSSMGHLWKDEIYPLSYRCIGFQTTVIRVTEWLGSGKASYPIPSNFPTKEMISVRDASDFPNNNTEQ